MSLAGRAQIGVRLSLARSEGRVSIMAECRNASHNRPSIASNGVLRIEVLGLDWP